MNPATPRPARPLSDALALGGAIVLAAIVLGVAFYAARRTPATVQVVGAATTQFETDVAKWRATLSRTASLDGLPGAYAALAQDVAALRSQLRGLGLPDTAVTVGPASSNGRYGQDGSVVGYDVTQTLTAYSPDVGALEGLALAPAGVATGGATLQGSQLEYFSSRLPELKRALLARATADARARADEIAGRGQTGAMTAASAGVFQITAPYSTDVESYGIHDTGSRRQEITVTVRATFVAD